MEENQVVEAEVVETPVEEVKADPIETKARDMGWRPKEEFDGDESEFIDAKEFVRRQPLFEKIEHLSKELKRIKQGHELLVEHTKKLKDTEYKRALEQVKALRKQAIMDGETDKALMYEEKLEEVEQMRTDYQEQAAQLEQPAQEEHPAFAAWRSQNAWYGKDEARTAYADSLGNKLARQGLTRETVLEEVAKAVRKEFAHKFTNPNREKAGSVEAPTRKATKAVEFDMPEQDRVVMNKILRAGGITKDEYMQQYKLINGVK